MFLEIVQCMIEKMLIEKNNLLINDMVKIGEVRMESIKANLME